MSDEAGIVCGTNSTSADNQYFQLEYCVEEMNSSTDYTEDGNYVSSTTDGRGYTATFSYDEDRDLLKSVVDAKGVVTSYTYNENNNRLLSVSTDYISDTSSKAAVSYSYNTDGSIKTITSPNGITYGFTYDGFGRPLSTTVEGQVLGTYTYRDNYTSLVSRFDYGNGSYQEYTYDSADRIVSECINGVLTKSYIYDKFGNVAKETHNQLGITTKYRHDLSGKLTGLSDSNGQKINYVYDENDRITHEYYGTGDNDVTIGYDYGNNAENSSEETGAIYGVSYDGADKIQYSYDKLGRLNTRTLVGNDTNTKTSYTYLKGDKINSTTSMIDTMSLYYTVDEETQPSWTEYSYTYDEVGNITSISKDGVVQESYTYDSLNQLTQVQRGNDTYRYTYDNGGNLVNVIKNDIEYLKEYEYDERWKDLLVYYNDDIITYDSIGNPLRYRDGMTMTWTNGRQLSSITGLTNNVSYEYDGDGYRKYKTVGTEPKISYSYVGGVLRSEKSIDREMLYFYDEKGTIAGVKIIEDGVETIYYYQLNIQGDVIGILNEDGIQVVAYTYDEWGKVLSVIGSESTGIGELNPIRYRGYYYDSETGFYYLLSRYYDPETGRFLNSDDMRILFQTGIQVLGTNLLSYCHNNPINLFDLAGYQPKWAQVVVRYAKGTKLYKGFLKATQKGWYSDLFWAAGFFRTSDGVYHTRQDCWQRIFGYNDFYDWAFNLGTSMSRQKFPFFSGKKEYIFWGWKGDYYNLGAGAELGFYSRLVINGKRVDHWRAETSSLLFMTMILRVDGRIIATYRPKGRQWWITCFNPFYQNIVARRISVSVSIDFSRQKTLFNNFYNKYKNIKNNKARWTFYKRNYRATLTF